LLNQLSLSTIKKHWRLVAALAVLGAVTAYGVSMLMAPLYRSTAALYVTLNFGNTASELAQGSTYTANQMLSMGELATAPVVLKPVIERLSLPTTPEDLAKTIDVSTPRDTVIMQISVTSTSPQLAADIANAVAAQASDAIESFAPLTASGSPSVIVRSMADAIPPDSQFSPDKKLNAAAGLALGGLLGVLCSYLLSAFDNRMRGIESLTGLTEAPHLGSLRRIPNAAGREAVVLQEPTSQAAEEYRNLRSNLYFASMRRHPLVVVISSSVPNEGKTTVAVNLAAVLGESGQKVLLVDADLRKPLIAEYAQIADSAGLSEVLVGLTTLEQAVQPLGTSGVDVLVSGTVPPNPGELVASSNMTALLKQARSVYDIVVVDTAPILAVADAVSLVQDANGMVLVTRAGFTHKTDVAESLRSVTSAGGTVFGVVINAVNSRSDRTLRDYQYTVGTAAPTDSDADDADTEEMSTPAGTRVAEPDPPEADAVAPADPQRLNGTLRVAANPVPVGAEAIPLHREETGRLIEGGEDLADPKPLDRTTARRRGRTVAGN
jgi:capsular exopolysaccharide synthesis family protein